MEDIDPALAAAMGFSSFGGQPGSKKRKYNHSTDAIVDGQQPKNSNGSSNRPKGSGSNKTPLGIRERGSTDKPTSPGGTDSQSLSIKHDDRDNPTQQSNVASESGHPSGTPTHHDQPAAQPNDRPTGKKKQGTRTGLAAFLPSGQSAQPSNVPEYPASADNVQTSDADASIATHAPSQSKSAAALAGRELTPAELQALRRGVTDERGDTAYFLPSFIEDPWRHLRRAEDGG